MPDEPLTPDDLRGFVKCLRVLAADQVRAYARQRCQHVSAADVDVICRALGDVSLEEAFSWLDGRERGDF